MCSRVLSITGQKLLRKGKGFCGLHFWIIVYHLRESGQELKQGLEADTIEECCLPVCSMAHAQLASFIAQELRTR